MNRVGKACEKTCWQVLAYCLMSNHFDLVIETPLPNPLGWIAKHLHLGSRGYVAWLLQRSATPFPFRSLPDFRELPQTS